MLQSNDEQEMAQDLALAKEKNVSAWNDASRSIFLLDEQSQKIEELSEQLRQLKAYYSKSNDSNSSKSEVCSDQGPVTESAEPKIQTNVSQSQEK